MGHDKTVLKVRFTALKAHISKDEKPQVSNQSFQIKKPTTNRIKRSPKEGEGRK